MKHYPHHIGDFDRATRHLTRIERSVYRDLLDLYYDTEQRLPLDTAWLCRRIIARSDEESTAVEQVLNEFFTKTSTGWYHARCEVEIEAYRANSSQKAKAGKASAEAKRRKKEQALKGAATDVPTPVEQPLNSVATAGNGIATNHEPITNNNTTSLRSVVLAPHATPPPEGEPPERDPPKRATRLPDDCPTTEDIAWAQAERPDLDVRSVAATFRDHWIAVPGKDGRKLEWSATWRNWVRKQRPSTGPPTRYTPQTEKFNASAYVNNPEYKARWDAAKRLRNPTDDAIDVTARAVG
jgi:uncharacterized protein YdaU (DUF1376 family)